GLMITVVNQTEADRDIPRLLALKAKWGIPWVGLSMEPVLGQVILRPEWLAELNWAICGGESGPGARPMHPDWARSLRDQCQAAGVPFFFKQHGNWVSTYDRDRDDPDWCKVPKPGDWDRRRWLNLAGGQGFHGDKLNMMTNVGKARAGRLLDGREWNQFPGGAV
ncbi:MAG: DUF5131 family protein, partial [Beijerinckiaceae bacterium]